MIDQFRAGREALLRVPLGQEEALAKAGHEIHRLTSRCGGALVLTHRQRAYAHLPSADLALGVGYCRPAGNTCCKRNSRLCDFVSFRESNATQFWSQITCRL